MGFSGRKPSLFWAGAAAALAASWAIAARLLPGGLPAGIVLYGAVLGGLSSLTAMGLVIVYRSARIINFAQAEIGGLAASMAVVMVVGWHLPYLLAVPAGLAVAVATGAVVDLTVVRTLFRAPRLILTVATIGLAQVLGGLELFLPHLFAHVRPLTTFTTPFSWRFKIFPIVFNGNDILAMVVVPAVLVGLALFFTRSGYGIAIRGAADSNDRALLLGIPVRRLSTLTWVLAAGLSGLGSILAGPILGPQLGVLAGPEALLAPLAAAVLGRLESLTVAFVASIGIGIFEQAVFWSYPRSTTVDVALFGVILVALLLQRHRQGRAVDAGLGGYVAQHEVRPIPAMLRSLPEVRVFRAAVLVAVVLAAVVVPLGVSDSKRTLLAYVAIFGILAVSLVLLTGWAGQISLGQFAFAGVGAGTTASLFVHAHADLFVSLAMAAVAGGFAALVIGVPALRISGPFMAVATLAFAVPVSDFLLNSSYFPSFAPSTLARPAVLQRFDLNSAATFYYFCLFFLALSVALVWNYRRGRPGRTTIAVRDNQRGAQSFGISPRRSRLVAFALSGSLAGVAGGLYALGLRGIPFSGYNPETSLQIFTMVVVGGMGSLSGGLLGAFYVQGAQYFLSGSAQLLATGGGILAVVQLFPGGLAEVVYRVRDFALRRVASARGLSVPSLRERAAFAEPGMLSGPQDGANPHADTAELGVLPPHPKLVVSGLDASYGPVQVLFGVNIAVGEKETVGLLGTNGSGKSTLLKVASGLLKAGRGTVSFEGEDITKMHPVERVRRGLVMVPSGRSVFPSLTVRENLRLAGWVHRRDGEYLAGTSQRVLSLFPSLERRLDTLAGELSGGEQQMLTIAQALFCRPRLLMIDELSLGLAPSVVADLLGVVRQLAAEGVTVVVVEQSLNVAASMAERAVFMERGQVRFTGRTAELAQRPDLVRSVFLGNGRAARRPRSKPASPRRPDRLDGVQEAIEPVFSVTDVGKTFGAVTALEAVSFEVLPGEILGIIGANGAGKTTLFDACSGFVQARGRIHLGGLDVTELPPHQRAELGLGRLFQDARLFPSLTVSEVLAVALDRRLEVRDPLLSMLRSASVSLAEEEAAEAVEELLEGLGLGRYRDSFVSELSTGTRRVVELACVMAHQPSVLLLDEPTSGLAQRESEALGERLVDLRERNGLAMVVVEHDVPLVSSISDRLICLDLGRVIAEGPPPAVINDPLVVAAYLGGDPSAIARSGRAAKTRASKATGAGRASTAAGPGRASKATSGGRASKAASPAAKANGRADEAAGAAAKLPVGANVEAST